jgi:holin-like protein
MYNLPKAGRRGMMVHEFCKKEGYCVKYIFQFARITAFCLAGEVLAAVLPLPIPASVYGLVLLLLALNFRLIRLEDVKEVGVFLTGIFPLLFVPAAAGVMEMGEMLLPILIAIIPVTVLVMVTAGKTTQALTSRKKDKEAAANDGIAE